MGIISLNLKFIKNYTTVLQYYLDLFENIIYTFNSKFGFIALAVI